LSSASPCLVGDAVDATRYRARFTCQRGRLPLGQALAHSGHDQGVITRWIIDATIRWRQPTTWHPPTNATPRAVAGTEPTPPNPDPPPRTSCACRPGLLPLSSVGSVRCITRSRRPGTRSAVGACNRGHVNVRRARGSCSEYPPAARPSPDEIRRGRRDSGRGRRRRVMVRLREVVAHAWLGAR
jgi:hypothetical protein